MQPQRSVNSGMQLAYRFLFTAALLLISGIAGAQIAPLIANVSAGQTRKGLFSDGGERKKAFFVLQQYYRDLQADVPNRKLAADR